MARAGATHEDEHWRVRVLLQRVPLSSAVLGRSVRAAAVVGTVLTALNQGDLFLQGSFPSALWWKVPLTYAIPLLVATYGALGGKGALQS